MYCPLPILLIPTTFLDLYSFKLDIFDLLLIEKYILACMGHRILEVVFSRIF